MAIVLKEEETLVISYVKWPYKAVRNAGMKKLTNDLRMQFGNNPPVFDGGRLIAVAFKPMFGASDI